MIISEWFSRSFSRNTESFAERYLISSDFLVFLDGLSRLKGFDARGVQMFFSTSPMTMHNNPIFVKTPIPTKHDIVFAEWNQLYVLLDVYQLYMI